MMEMTNDQAFVDPQVAKKIQSELLAWYYKHKRDLPWRKDQDPYQIWVSEVMLQQTKVATVIPYYQRFLKRFPKLEDLAGADEEEVLKLWEGLGYYSRARNLHQAVREVRDSYGGKVPDNPKELSKLKGIGPYTKGAILSIAYNQKQPAVDGNVMRVLSRWFTLFDDIAQPRTRTKMEKIAMELISEEAPGDFNQALMELGATICTPTSPSCLFCPVPELCNAYQAGLQDELPVKKKKKAPNKTNVLFLAIRVKEELLLEKRPPKGLLAGLWSLPTIEYKQTDNWKEKVENYCSSWQSSFQIKGEIAEFEHIFSHRHWNILLLEIEFSQKPLLPSNYSWVFLHQLDHYAFANVYAKALQILREKG